MIHHVFFWLKEPGNAAHKKQLIKGLQSLGVIDEIRALRIGVPARTEERDVVDSSYDVSEIMEFDSLADQTAYQQHPVHLAFVLKCEHLWKRVVAYDTVNFGEDSEAGTV